MRTSLLVVALLGACATAPDAFDEAEQAATTAFPNDKAAFDFFVGKGLTNFQAAGIVGNLDQESGVNPASVQPGGPGRGIAQWSVGGRWDTSANDNVRAYAAQHGESMTALTTQLEFIWYELTTIGYGYAQLKATTNVTDATVEFMTRYEICGNCIQTQRVAYAKAVLAAYGATPAYGAAFVSQSWPLAAKPPLVIHCGESVTAELVLKNTGSKPWTSATHLGTTVPRDRASRFAGADWISTSRAAAIAGTVAPGATGTFSFSFDAPTGAACVPGTYAEHFGIVQESVAWFSDAGDGGPPDDQLEARIQLVPGDAVPTDGGVTGGDAGTDPGNPETGDAPGGCATTSHGSGLLVVALGLALRRRRA